MSDSDQARFRNANLGFVYQFHHLIEELTAVENVALPSRIGGLEQDSAVELAAELLSRLSLTDRLNHYPSQLSGGERQRCAIARSMINRPGIIFADEPTGNLDQHSAMSASALLKHLCQEFGVTLVVVTHNSALANQADRQLVLRDGQLHVSQ
ncbi:MAG: ABC transporter ATP-binding protein [Candidatus Azotimanducaceae bacterium]